MRAISDGRIEGRINAASDLFAESKCLIVAVYNRLYGAGQYIPSDSEITVEGCNGALAAPNILEECTAFPARSNARTDDNCDGIDDDCDGEVDEHYAATSCGLGLCQAESTCIAGYNRGIPSDSALPLIPRATTPTMIVTASPMKNGPRRSVAGVSAAIKTSASREAPLLNVPTPGGGRG